MKIYTYDDRTRDFIDVFRNSAERNGYEVCFLRPGDPPPDYLELTRNFRNFSPNPEAFELACYRRWFEVAQVVSDTDRFLMTDTDLIIFTGWNDLPQEIRDHDGFVGSVGVNNQVLETAINAGFSVWTGRLMKQFCKFVNETYSSGIDSLESKYKELLAAGNPRAAISDMTLLYRWVTSENVNFFNSNRILRDSNGRGHYIDHNIYMNEALDVRFRMFLCIKAFKRHANGLDLFTSESERISADCVHLGGRSKMLSRNIDVGDTIGSTRKNLYLTGGRAARKLLASVGINR